jgi:DNA-binding SARP family transcriptional activator
VPVEFRVLGPLEVRVHDRPLPLGGTRPRVVLAALLLGRNTVVPVERLISAIWGDEPPGTPTAQIQAAVSTLRKTLGASRIVTRTPGYLVRIDRGELDLDEFDREVAAARRALDEGDATRAADGLRAALEWWRDDALVDLAELPIRAAAVPIDERRWTAWEERIEADLTLRRHADLVAELSTLVAEKPLRDRLWAQLMRAQYRCGRRADALDTYQRARRVMRDELGLEPAAELIAVHRAILADDQALDPDVLPLGPRPEWTRPPCPYRALVAYQPDDAGFFFGRSAEIAAVVDRARTGPVTVVGPSGSGKSSLVRAGVLPALAGHTPLLVRPSDHGRLDLALAAAVARASPPDDRVEDGPSLTERIGAGDLADVVGRVLAHTGDARLVVVLDQAEEVLTQDAPLVDRVVAGLFAPDLADRLTVVATLRADLLGEVLQRPALSATLGGPAVFTLGAMGRDQLREAITGPIAALPGVAFQPGLVDRILADVGSEPGSLALLGLTLTLLWDEQVDGTLTHQAYDDLGRVPGALNAHAEGEWRRRNLAGEEPVFRRLVGRLVEVPAGGHVTRRVASRSELDEHAWRLAVRLATTRLLVVAGDGQGAQTVELAHEALTSHWPRLRGLIESDAEFHLWRTALRGDLERWRCAGRDPALLVRGTVLADARRWCAEHDGELGADEVDFVRRSQHHQRSGRRRSGAVRVGLAAAAVLVLVLGVVFAQQRSRTAQATAEADSRALAAESVTAADRDPAYAGLMAVAAYDRAPTDEARSALFARYRDIAALDTLYAAHGAGSGAAGASADGHVVAAANDRGEVTVWVHDPDRPVRLLHAASRHPTFGVAPDGSAVWVLAPDGIARVDTASGATRTAVPVGWSGSPLLSLSADGTRILLQDRTGPGPSPIRIRQWRTADGQELGGTVVPDPGTASVTVRAGRSPETLLIESTSAESYGVEELDLGSGSRSVVATGPAGALASDFSSVVTCTATGGGYVLSGVRVADRLPFGRLVLPGDLSFCPDFAPGPGSRVVVRAGYEDVRVVDLATGATAKVGMAGGAAGLGPSLTMLTQDGSRLLVTGSSWVGLADLVTPTRLAPVLRNAQVLDDGRGLVGVADDGSSLVLSPLVAGAPAAVAPRPSAYLSREAGALRVGHRGVLADRVADDQVALRSLPGLEPLATVSLPAGRLGPMFFDAADQLVTVVDHEVYGWDSRTGALRYRLDLEWPERAARVAATPDPGLLAVSDREHPDVTLRSVLDGRTVDTLPLGAEVDDVGFQGASHYVLVSRPHSTEVWDSRTKQRVLGPLPVADGATRVAGMTRQPGRIVALDSRSGRWQLSTYEVGVAGPLSSLDLGSGAEPASLSAEGDVVSLDRPDGALAAVLRLDPAVWRSEVCAALAGADLTATQRAGHPGVADGPVCPGTGRGSSGLPR